MNVLTRVMSVAIHIVIGHISFVMGTRDALVIPQEIVVSILCIIVTQTNIFRNNSTYLLHIKYISS